MIPRIAIVLVVAALGACATGPNLPKLSASSGRLGIDGATFASPGEEGWYIGLQTPYHLGLIKRGDNPDETIAIEAQLFKVPAAAPGVDFTQAVRDGEDRDTDPKRFNVTTHDVTPVKLGGATCARSHMVAQDQSAHTPSGKYATMTLETFTLNCVHPQDPRVGVNITYSERYYPGQADPQLAAKAAAVLDSIELGTLKE